jgi:HNH endonuclease
MFAERVPDGCPDDPIEKQKFLTAHALASLLDGTAGVSRAGRPEYVAVIDADATGQPGPVVEWSIPVEIPTRILAELTDDADVHAVVVRNGVVLYAPGELNLGRSTRLASRAQRRALRSLYRGCAIPGCTVGSDRCRLHHLIWWRHGGLTDLDNLIPLCSRHHDKIHHDHWTIELGPHRELTLRLPDGTIHNTGPPGRRNAA